MREIAMEAKTKGFSSYLCYANSRTNLLKYEEGDILIGNRITRNIGIFVSEVLGFDFLSNLISTVIFLIKIRKLRPHVFHLHNLHGSFINTPVLFWYLKKTDAKVVWTLHDCWALTGHCTHYVTIGCDKWKKLCHNCPVHNEYPKCCYDNSKNLYKIKKRTFTSLNNLTIVTPSEWLAQQVKDSFLNIYPTYVINNGINTDLFYPRLRNRNISTTIIAVASIWSKDKGLYDIQKLLEILPSNFKIIIVGSGSEILGNKNNLVRIARTHNQRELADLYRNADVAISLSHAETFGMTIAEALSCGTPVVVYNNTAQPELINEYNGRIVEEGDIKGVLNAIVDVMSTLDRDKMILKKRNLDRKHVYKKYLSLYL